MVAGLQMRGLEVQGAGGPEAWAEVLNGNLVWGGGRRGHPWVSRAGSGPRNHVKEGCSLRADGLGLLGHLCPTGRAGLGHLVRGEKGGTSVCIGRYPEYQGGGYPRGPGEQQCAREAPCVPSACSP